MKTEEILNLDFRKEENKIKIQNVLRKIKPLSKYSEEDVPLEMLEKLVLMYHKKYDVKLSYIMLNTEGIMIYSASLRNEKGNWLGNIYGSCIYELFAKACIKIYAEGKKGTIERKEK